MGAKIGCPAAKGAAAHVAVECLRVLNLQGEDCGFLCRWSAVGLAARPVGGHQNERTGRPGERRVASESTYAETGMLWRMNEEKYI